MLPKSNRLQTKDIGLLFKKGQSLHSPLFSLRFLYKKGESRFTIIVPNKVSKKANIRNLFKRRVRNIIYKNLKNIKTGYYIAVFLKPEVRDKKSNELESDIIGLFKKANLLN